VTSKPPAIRPSLRASEDSHHHPSHRPGRWRARRPLRQVGQRISGRIRPVAAGLTTTLAAGAVALATLSPSPALAQQAGGFDLSSPQVAATGLVAPWGLTFLPNGDALIAERDSAQILRITAGGGGAQVVGTVPNVDPAGEGGLLGLAASPNQDGWVYAYHTSPSDNRIVRFPANSPQNAQPVLTGIPRGTIIHNGGRIAFGPDGMLYAATGDAGVTANAQNLNSLAGKILRMTPEGTVPPDNPFPGSLVYSLGHRNVQGLAWDAQGRLWASEFGANSLDEVNLIQPGGNYGWPTCEGRCNPPNSGFIDPQVVWTTAEASPSGAAFANGHLFVAALRGQRLWVVPLAGDQAGTPFAELTGQFGRLRTVEVGPDGWLWVATNNRDGRGNPAPSDDRVLRFPPTGTPPTTQPPTTQPPTTQPPTSGPPTGAPGGCQADYQVVNEWPGGFQGSVTVTNTSGASASGWQVTWTYSGGQQITQLWSGRANQVGASVTVENETWNGQLGQGASTEFGFLANWSGTNPAPTDVACTLR